MGSDSKTGSIVAGISAVVMLIFLIFLLHSCASLFDSVTELGSRAPSRSRSARSRQPGVLSSCNMCSDEATSKRLTKLAIAKDYTGINMLVLQGKVVQIEAGTEAKIIDRGILTTEVKIMSGPYTGRYGIVPSEAIY